MGDVVFLNASAQEKSDLLQCLVEGLANGLDALERLDYLDQSAAYVFVGYLSAGEISLRSNGLERPAANFLNAANSIRANWQDTKRTVQALLDGL